MIITEPIVDEELENGNLILGTFPTLINSKIKLNGKNNILFCEPNVTLSDSTLKFAGNNALIYLSENRHYYKLGVEIWNDSVFYMGKGNFINQKMTVVLSEQRHVFIGDYGAFSIGIWIRNADPHLIYDCNTRKRKNPTKSVYVGDHVWVGQGVMLLKGTQIDSGSIIGAKAVVAGKKVAHNTAWAGNPAKQVAKDVFWDKACVHSWQEEMTATCDLYDDYIEKYHKDFKKDAWIFEFAENEVISFDDIDNALNSARSNWERLDYIKKLNEIKSKNRFIH